MLGNVWGEDTHSHPLPMKTHTRAHQTSLHLEEREKEALGRRNPRKKNPSLSMLCVISVSFPLRAFLLPPLNTSLALSDTGTYVGIFFSQTCADLQVTRGISLPIVTHPRAACLSSSPSLRFAHVDVHTSVLVSIHQPGETQAPFRCVSFCIPWT